MAFKLVEKVRVNIDVDGFDVGFVFRSLNSLEFIKLNGAKARQQENVTRLQEMTGDDMSNATPEELEAFCEASHDFNEFMVDVLAQQLVEITGIEDEDGNPIPTPDDTAGKKALLASFPPQYAVISRLFVKYQNAFSAKAVEAQAEGK